MSEALLSAYAFQPLASDDGRACLYPLHETTLLQIQGKDAAKFMQGQMTANIQEITPQQWRRGANCTAKGRMVNSFTLLQANNPEPTYLLTMHSPLLEISMAHLKKYAVFFKASLQNAPDWVLLGAHGHGIEPLLQNFWPELPGPLQAVQNQNGCLLHMDIPGTWQLWLKRDAAQEILDKLAPQLQLQSAEQGLAHYLRAGIGRVRADTTELFIPQMLNLHKNAGISFNKGCYTGQEIIARMQYLGKLKRHMYPLRFTANAAPAAGTHIYSPLKNSEVGELAEAIAVAPGEYLALAVIEDEFKDSPLQLGQDNPISLELLSLPYSLD